MTEHLVVDPQSLFPAGKVMVVINRHSRAGALNQPAAKPQQIAELLESRGVTPDIHWIEPRRLPTVLRRIAEDSPESIIVGGGDGTVNAAANVFAQTATIVGILPLGTFNHLAKDLEIPMRLEDAVCTLFEGQVTPIDLGRMNDKLFVNHASVGIYPHAVSKRKAYQRTLGVGRLPAMGYALLEAVLRRPAMELDLQHDQHRQHLKTPFVFVGNNRFETAPFSFIRRQALDEGHLHVLYVPPLPAFAFLRIALSILFGGLRNAPELRQQWRASVKIISREKHLRISLDGEVSRETPPLEFHSQPRALRVITPVPSS